MKKAKEEAERQWVEKEGTSLGDDKVRKVLEEKWKHGKDLAWWDGVAWWHWRLPKWEQIFDGVVESVIE